MILHTVKQSPFVDLTLSQALGAMGQDDILLLLENGVIAGTAQHAYYSQLADLAAQGRLYLIADDLQARGVNALIGKPINYSGFVELVTQTDASLAW